MNLEQQQQVPVCCSELQVQVHNLTKTRAATTPRTPRTPRVRTQPEDDFSDSSGGLGGYEYPQWYAPPEEGVTYYPGKYC